MVKINTIEQRNSIRIAILGKVSCGKSTLLNAIFVKKYANMQMIRTTMLPFVYQETNKNIHTSEASKKIYQENVEMNERISRNEMVLTDENCKEIINLVPQIENFVVLPNNIFLDIYDIPGLDDGDGAGTSEAIYFKWVTDNFYKFDIIIHMVDINSALNTSGEMKILNLITDCIKKEKDENDREIQLFTVVNKCDDMNINPKTKGFEFDGEIQKMYDQITKRTNEVYESKQLHGICNFTPLSAVDTYIYRMLNNDPNTELLNMNLLNKFGQNELGKKNWNRSTEQYKRNFIREYFSESDVDIDLELTGYIAFKAKLNDYLSKDNQYNILINRIKYELSQESILNKNITKNID